MVYGRSSRDRHVDSHTDIIQGEGPFLKVTVTRCCFLELGGFEQVTVTDDDRRRVNLGSSMSIFVTVQLVKNSRRRNRFVIIELCLI